MLKLRRISAWFVPRAVLAPAAGCGGDPVPLRAAEARLIVLPDSQTAGAGQTRSSAVAGDADFFIRSASA